MGGGVAAGPSSLQFLLRSVYGKLGRRLFYRSSADALQELYKSFTAGDSCTGALQELHRSSTGALQENVRKPRKMMENQRKPWKT